jgi:hypothetical protein
MIDWMAQHGAIEMFVVHRFWWSALFLRIQVWVRTLLKEDIHGFQGRLMSVI